MAFLLPLVLLVKTNGKGSTIRGPSHVINFLRILECKDAFVVGPIQIGQRQINFGWLDLPVVTDKADP